MGTMHETAISLATNKLAVIREIVDGGSNEGHIASQFLRLCPKANVHVFEPNPEVFPKLAKNLECWRNRVVFNQSALGLFSGSKHLFVAEPSAASSLFKPNEAWDDLYPQVKWPGKHFDVEVVNLKDYMNDWGLAKIDFLKLDTQGYEFQILMGAEDLLEQHRIEYILAEVFFTPFYDSAPLAGVIFTYLAEFGYYPAWICNPPPQGDWTRHADILFTYRRD